MQAVHKLIFLLCVILASSLTFAFSGSGAGTSISPYIITNCTQLQEANNSLASYYVLGNDINCSETEIWNDGNGFTPIGGCGPNNECDSGNNSYVFNGNFNGKGFVIKNLYIYRPSKSYIGLFGDISAATIQNVGVVDQNITGDVFVGGLAGFSKSGATIKFSFSTGTTKGLTRVGGIIGHCSYASIQTSYTTGITKSSTSYSYVGGLVGYNDSCSIQNSYNTGNVLGSGFSGGLIGWNQGSLSNSFNIGSVSGSASVAGLTGANNSSIKNSFNTGLVTASTIYAYGIVGQTSIGTISNSYWDTVLSTKSTCFPDSNSGCTFTNNSVVSYYGASGIPFTNLGFDTNFWVVKDNNYPALKEFLNCSGAIDNNAAIYVGDDYGVKSVNNKTNILSSSNTSTTCEWYCKDGYYKGTGADSNKCLIKYFNKGTGTISDPWVVTNCTDLQNINKKLDGNYILGSDINCYTETHLNGTLYNGGSGFSPIGTTSIPFSGNIDGQNHIIYSLYSNKSQMYEGLVGLSECAVIKNLGMIDANIIGSLAGGLAGSLKGKIDGSSNVICYSSIENSFVKGFIQGSFKTGGLTGVTGSSKILNSYFDGNLIAAEISVGGITGTLSNSSILKNSFAKGSIFATSITYIGGISGWVDTLASITNSYNLIELNFTSSDYAGGLAGANSASIANSFSAVSATNFGKVIGNNFSGTILNLYCLGSGSDSYCITNPLKSDFYSSIHAVYPSWNDGNWYFGGNFFPQLTKFPYCSGPIDSNAVIYSTDWTGLKTTDNLVNTLSSSNTSTTCEWHCKDGFYKPTGQNSCVLIPIQNYCTGKENIDSNAIAYDGDEDGVIPENEMQIELVNSNTSRKCQYHCKDGFDLNSGKCVLIKNYYHCIGDTFMHAVAYTGDENDLTIFDYNIRKLKDNDTSLKCEWHCVDNNYYLLDGRCVQRESEIAVCGIKTKYSQGEVFVVQNSLLCEKGTAISVSNLPIEDLSLTDFDGAVADWKCVALDQNAYCRATRVYSEIIDVNAILDLNAKYTNKTTLLVNLKCSKNTFAELKLFDGKGIEILLSSITTVPCGVNYSPIQLISATSLVAEKTYSLTASIKSASPDCSVCSQTVFVYIPKESSSSIPDNSLILVMVVLIVSVFVLKKNSF